MGVAEGDDAVIFYGGTMKRIVVGLCFFLVMPSLSFAASKKEAMQFVEALTMIIGVGEECGVDVSDYKRRAINFAANTSKGAITKQDILDKIDSYKLNHQQNGNKSDCVSVKSRILGHTLPLIDDYDQTDIDALLHFARVKGEVLICGILANPSIEALEHTDAITWWIGQKFRSRQKEFNDLYLKEYKAAGDRVAGKHGSEFCAEKIKAYRNTEFPVEGVYYP